MYDDEMTLGQWIATLVITCIPCVNIIMLIVWAAGSGNATRKKWAGTVDCDGDYVCY